MLKSQALLKNIVVFASGSGTNFQSLIDAVQYGDLKARLAGLIANKSGITAIERAKNAAIPFYVLKAEDFQNQEEYNIQLLKQLEDWDADLIVLAGYLKKIPAEVVQIYSGRILNIHPALLPKYGGKGFYGINVHKAVIEAGDEESGCTVHVVTNNFDEGPILAQAKVPVLYNDTPQELAKRILEQEHKLLPEVIKQYLLTF